MPRPGPAGFAGRSFGLIHSPSGTGRWIDLGGGAVTVAAELDVRRGMMVGEAKGLEGIFSVSVIGMDSMWAIEKGSGVWLGIMKACGLGLILEKGRNREVMEGNRGDEELSRWDIGLVNGWMPAPDGGWVLWLLMCSEKAASTSWLQSTETQHRLRNAVCDDVGLRIGSGPVAVSVIGCPAQTLSSRLPGAQAEMEAKAKAKA